MKLIELILLSFGLAADAFVVSVCKGLTIKEINLKKYIIVGLYFGLFQALMPLLGYILGNTFTDIIISINHYISFGLLVIIGINMIKEVRNKDEEENTDKIDFKTMFPLAIATSIDALAVGITFSFLKVNIFSAITLIGLITFIISFIGVAIGNKIGNKINNTAKIIGGIILILIGIKILLEHLNLI